MDTVFHQNTDLIVVHTPKKISGPGIGDNSSGLAGLFGLYWGLKESIGNIDRKLGLEGDLWLVANVGEEGLGDLKGIKEVLYRSGDDVMAYIILEGMSFGQIYHQGLGVRRYRISVQINGGHSRIDDGNPSAIHELADSVAKIKNLPLTVEP